MRSKKMLPSALLAAAVLTGCAAPSPASPAPAATIPATSAESAPAATIPAPPAESAPGDRPTVPDEPIPGLSYDFTFSERYDRQVSGDYALTLPQGEMLRLLDRYTPDGSAETVETFDGDGMVVNEFKRYHYTLEGGSLVVETDAYPLDGLEFLSSLFTDLPGAATGQGAAVGSSEAEVLAAYPDHLYRVDPAEGEPRLAEGLEGVDALYVWQPYRDNDIRDITFYMRDGAVAAIEMTRPYELRYVYGHDRDTELAAAEEARAALAEKP